MEQDDSTTSSLQKVDVDIVDLFEYAAESRRNWIEGNQIYNSNHVLMVGVTRHEGDHIHIFGSCLRGSNPSEPPRQVNIVTGRSLKEWKISCSYPAGAFRCKHQFACLLYIHNRKMLDVLTPTELRQQWGKVAKAQSGAMYEPIPLHKLCGFEQQPKDFIKEPALYDQLLNLFETELPDSALAKSLQGRSVRRSGVNVNITEENVEGEYSGNIPHLQPELPLWNPHSNRKLPANPNEVPHRFDLVQSYIQTLSRRQDIPPAWAGFIGPLSSAEQYTLYSSKVCLTFQDCESIAAATVDGSNERWRKERRIRITASICYDLYTFFRNDDGSRDWTKKLSSIIHPLEMRLPSLLYGKETEAMALNCYQRKRTDSEISRMGLFVSPYIPFLGCTPDAVVFSQRKLIEIKCPVSGKLEPMEEMIKKCKYLRKDGESFTLNKKHAYYGQVQLGMFLLKLKTTDFVVYNKKEDNFICLSIEYDFDFVNGLIPTLREIYFNTMLPAICEK